VVNAKFTEFTSTFESGYDGWTLENGTQANSWVRGSGKSCCGSYSMYASHSGGTYSTSSASLVHFYREIGSEAGTLSFDVVGIHGDCNADYVQASVASSVPVAGSVSDATYYGGNYCGYTSCQRITINIPAGTGNRYLIFTWRNDNAIGGQPIAVDNITYRPTLSMPIPAVIPRFARNDGGSERRP
jgi:hypothetical protein